jgi:hypothetical protein
VAEADVDALGCLTYLLTTGYWPGGVPLGLASAPRTGEQVLPPSQVRASVPENVDDVVARSLAVAPASRGRDAVDSAAAFAAAAGAAFDHVTPVTTSFKPVHVGPPSTRRRVLGVAGRLVAVALAVVVPSFLVGDEGQRDALGVLVGAPTGPTDEPVISAEVGPARIFSVYGSHGSLAWARESDEASPGITAHDLFGILDRPGVAAACAADGRTCVADEALIGMALRPTPIVLLEPGSGVRWQATPFADVVSGDRFAMYWLARRDLAP